MNVGVKNAGAAPGAAAGAPAAAGPGARGGGGGCRPAIWQDQVRYQVSQQGLVWLGLALVCGAEFIFVILH